MIKWTIGAIALMVVFCCFGGSFLLGDIHWALRTLIGFAGGWLAKSIIEIRD